MINFVLQDKPIFSLDICPNGKSKQHKASISYSVRIKLKRAGA